jgi:asparagine synthase (glutamine-hydrolysing)
MCGVAAIFVYHYAASNVDRDELRAIRDHMRARGPDGAGEWFSDDGHVALGHRRLSIIDLSDGAAQPMASADGMLRISYNGEIYNYRELRARMESCGVRFRTQSDTEVLLAMYEHHGERMFEHLRGMYALALWDARKGAMLLARDPYGIKPLYINDDGWTVRVASQVRALLASPRVSRAPEPAGQVGFFLFGSVPEPWTLYQQIRAVPSGCYQWVGETGPREPVRHFDLAKCVTDGSSRLHDDEFDAAIRDSVRAHLVADVPVGLFLSAGIDSGALASHLGAIRVEPTIAATVTFDEFQGSAEDEAPLAAQIASRYSLRHVVRRVAREEFVEDLPRILDAMDQPSIDGINTWFVAKACREQGLKVALSGVGADELLGGYDSFRDIPQWVRATRWARVLPGLGTASRVLVAPLLARSGTSPKAAGMLELGTTFAGAYLLRRGLFMPWELPRVLPRDSCVEGLRRLQWKKLVGSRTAGALPGEVRVLLLESQLYLRNQLLRDCDWASMAHGLEVRTPYVDATLAARIGPLLAGPRAGEGKRRLAESSSPPLPAAIVDRRKTGFSTPIRGWLEREPRLAAPPMFQGQHWSRRLAIGLIEGAAS